MSNSSDLPGEQPKSIWTRPIKVKFGKLAESLGKGAIAGAFGNWAGVAGSGVDALKALGLGGQEVEAIAWMLVQRSLLQAMSDLAAPYQKDLTQEPDFAQLCEQLDTALEEGSLTLSPEFFDRPKDLEILGAVNMPYRRWLQTCGLPKTEAEAIAGRLPTHFVFALNEQWRSHPQEYAVLKDRLDTPFTKATERERAWMRYGAWLQRRVDEPMFAEAFSLRQIYVPLRAYFLRAEKGEAAEARRLAEGREREKERVVVELERQLLDWLDHAKVGDTVRVICGGPGSGKSSFSKMLAAKLVAEEPTQRPLSVLFIPLHQLRDLSNDLSSTIDEFIQSDLDGMLPPNPLEKENAAKRLLLVFDGLDELAMQGKIAAQVAQDFIKEVKGSLLRFNRNEVRVLALMSGREVVVQASQNEFRQEGQVLHVLPYIQLEAELEKHRYIDEHRLLNRDQRQDWWRRYGKLKGQSYEGMPDELAQDSLAEITAQPLLNYLVALSHDRGALVFSEEPNLNAVYADLLKRVYSRDWESYPHPELGKISETNFVRLLEEIAVACWHGTGGRRQSSKLKTAAAAKL
ncbi:MAG: NACHT domain-containing protein [Elainellaceae cyanobacterium]